MMFAGKSSGALWINLRPDLLCHATWENNTYGVALELSGINVIQTNLKYFIKLIELI